MFVLDSSTGITLWHVIIIYHFHFYSIKIRIRFLQVTYLWTIYTRYMDYLHPLHVTLVMAVNL